MTNRRKNELKLGRFGAATALLFPRGGGSVEIALAPVEMLRLLEAWEEYENGKIKPDTRILTALKTLISKSFTKAPYVRAEVPIAATPRVQLLPDRTVKRAKIDQF